MSSSGAYMRVPVNGRIAPSTAKRDLFSNKNAHRRLASTVGADQHNNQEQGYMNEATDGKIVQLRSDEIDIPALRTRLRTVMDSDRLSQARVAKEAGVSTATLSQFLSDTYAGDNNAVGKKLQQWIASYEDRNSSDGLPAAPVWVETPTAQRVMDTLRYAQVGQDMVLVYGGAGTSKTKAIERYAQIAPSVFHVTMTPAHHNVMASLEKIVEVLGLREFARSSSGMHRAICTRLANTNGLLIIDEAQHLGVQALDQLRSIHDALHIGVALVGNEHIYARMTGGVRAPFLDRLFSRIGKRTYIPGASDADVDAIMKAWEIEDISCRNQVRDIAKKAGALRVLTKTLRLAAAYAKAASRDLCCEDIRAAWRELGGQ